MRRTGPQIVPGANGYYNFLGAVAGLVAEKG